MTSFRNVLDRTPAQKHFINWWNLLLTVSMPCGVSQVPPLLPSKPLPVIVVSALVINTLWFAFKGVFSSLDSLLAMRVCLSAGLLRSLWAVTLNMKTVWYQVYPVQNSCSFLSAFLSLISPTGPEWEFMATNLKYSICPHKPGSLNFGVLTEF